MPALALSCVFSLSRGKIVILAGAEKMLKKNELGVCRDHRGSGERRREREEGEGDISVQRGRMRKKERREAQFYRCAAIGQIQPQSKRQTRLREPGTGFESSPLIGWAVGTAQTMRE